MDTKKSRNRQPDHPYHQVQVISAGRERAHGELVKLFIQWNVLMEWRANATPAANAILLRRTGAVGICNEKEFDILVEDCQGQIKRRYDDERSTIAFENWLADFTAKAPKKMEEARRSKGIGPTSSSDTESSDTESSDTESSDTESVVEENGTATVKSKQQVSQLLPSQFTLQLDTAAPITIPTKSEILRTYKAIEILTPGATEPLVIPTCQETKATLKKEASVLPLEPGWSVRCEENMPLRIPDQK